jgi:hypothetical protein
MLAVITAVASTAVAAVPTVNVAELLPALIVTDAGTEAAVLLLANATTIPAGPAEPDNVTIPVEALPPITVLGLRASEAMVAGVTDNTADW